MGKKGTNEGWEFQHGWKKYRLVQRTETNVPPSPIDVRKGGEGSPVVGGGANNKQHGDAPKHRRNNRGQRLTKKTPTGKQ